MATQTVKVCDFEHGTCLKPALSYRVWRDGDKQASAIDLCDEHAAPLLSIVEGAELVELPTKARVRMEVTTLKTTPKTAKLKKE